MVKARSLSVDQQAAQVVMMGVSPSGALSADAQALLADGIGGVFYTSGAGVTRSSVAARSQEIQGAARIPVIVSVDQEGGQVQGLRGGNFTAIPAATTQGQSAPDSLRANWAAWAAELHEAGINVDLAPVADVVPAGTEAANPPVGAVQRQFGSDPAAVQASVGAVLDGMKQGGVSATLKHFPGLGLVTVNTDFGSATDSVTTLDSPSVQAFYANLPRTGMVMMSLATYTQIDPAAIAALSPAVHRALREHGFTGVVISDDMGHAVAVQGIETGQRAVRFLNAGGDMALAVSVETAATMVDAVRAQAQSDPQFAAGLVDHVARVLAYKESLGLYSCR